jgi:DNA replication ATP-dependent helicase Dna2
MLTAPSTIDLATTRANYETCVGPLWVIDDPGYDRPILVRSLGQVSGLLRVAPVLRLASTIDHPRLHGPSHWWRGDEGILIATPVPAGAPLAATTMDRRTWHEALDLWRPIADALRAAHSRGVVHGRINPWNLWYDPSADRLTLVDLGCWIGDATDGDPWCAPELLAQGGIIAPLPTADIQSLARLLVFLGLNPEEAQKSSPSFSGLPPYAIPTLARAFDADTERRPRRIDELISGVHFQGPSTDLPLPEAISPSEGQTILFGRVSGREPISNPRHGQGLRFFLASAQSVDDQATGAFFYEGVDRDLFHSIKWVWDGAELNLLDARCVTDSQGRTFLTGGADTLPVLEPHWPISVTHVLNAERCTTRFIVDERDGGGSSRALVFGNLVHGLLDDLTGATPTTFDEAIARRLPELRLSMLAAGLKDRDVEAFVSDARRHFEHIERFTAPVKTGSQEPADRVGWVGRHVEATRYSSLYGLEGRIDLVVDDAREGLQIIELKSGSPWDGHLSQLRSYTLLWEGVARRQDRPLSGYVLYSKNGQMKPVSMEDTRRERRILRARNELIALHRSYVDATYDYTPPHFMQIPANCNASQCNYRRARCKEQTDLLGLASAPEDATSEGGPWAGFSPEFVERAWTYHAHFTRLIERERWAENTSLGSILQSSRLEERVANHQALRDARLEEVDTTRGEVRFAVRGAQLFSPGDYVLAHRGDLNASHILRGAVGGGDVHQVILRASGAGGASGLPRDGWILDRLPARIGFRVAHQALYRTLKRRDQRLLQVLLEPQLPSSRALVADPESPGLDLGVLGTKTVEALNATQQVAVATALEAPVGALIQGPPGTGKTTVIAYLVDELVSRGKSVVLSALTHTAVDTLLIKLLEAGQADFLRIGSAARSRELSIALEARGFDPTHFFVDDLAASQASLDGLGERLRSCPVVATTAHGSISSPMFEYVQRALGPVPFDVAIIDEASQLTEPMALAPMSLARRFVLVGDHQQLPPIVVSDQSHSSVVDATGLLTDEAPTEEPPQLGLFETGPLTSDAPIAREPVEESLRAMGCAGLDRSLFERLARVLPHVMLDVQYRMHEDIMAFSSAAFYGGRLQAHPSTARPGLDVIDAPLIPSSPVVFVDVDADGDGRTNLAEARAVMAALETLRPSLGEATIGIVTPFRAQVHLIRQLLTSHPDLSSLPIDVDTVERFQGSERDVIMVSLVKTDRAGEFLADPRRLNVTLTRARNKLMLFGRRRCLELNPLFRRLIDQPQTTTVSWPIESC